jgi:nascent polypeptide-associated complex subunit beta
MFKDNGEVIHFTNPKVQASLGSNTFAISGLSDTKCKKESLIIWLIFVVVLL